MKRAVILLAFAALAVAIPVRGDFDSVVHAIESSSGLQRVHIPYFGLMRAAIWMVHPHGVSDFQLATWEGDPPVDRMAAGSIIRKTAGRGYSPVIESMSKRTGEWAFIYARPHGGNRVDVLVVSHDHTDTVVVRAVVDATMFMQDFDNPSSLSHVGRE
jgi:hypothetical protein